VAYDFPDTPTFGQLYPPFMWDGEKWVTAPLEATPGVIVADEPPTDVPDNTLWWESDSGLLYLLYNDGDSTQWVIAVPGPDLSMLVNEAPIDDKPYSRRNEDWSVAWLQMTQAEYDALAIKDANTLYVIVG
jgi:hypothetical protein